MSTNEILEELPQMAPAERATVWRLLEQLELGETEETSEMLAAIDAGRRSIQEGKAITVNEARKLLSQWTSKSS